MHSKELARRVLEELAVERASHGYGSAAAIDRRMNKGKGYLGRVLRGEVNLHVDTMFEALEAVEADLADFFVRVVGTRVRPSRLLQRLERQGAGDRPAILVFCERMLAGETVEIVEKVAVEPSAAVLEAELERLDEERFSDPAGAEQEAEVVVAVAARRLLQRPDGSSRVLLARALGVLAPFYRAAARFAPAARCLRLGLGLCADPAPRDKELQRVRAELLQRVCYLLGDQGDYRVAAEVARLAADAWVLLDDRAGIGKALADRAIMLGQAGETDAAVEVFLSSLKYLPEEAWVNRCSVYQGLGWIYALRGEIDEANKWAERTTAAHQTREGLNWYRLVWLEGEIALDRGQPDAAQRKLAEARAGFSDKGNPFDVAVVSLRLAKALFLAGELGEMQGLAAEMLCLLKPLGKHPIASAAIHEFTRATLTGEVTVELLDRASDQVRKGRSARSALPRL